MTFQLMFTIIAMVPTYHAWNYPTFHLSYIAFIFVVSLFFGASYYVEIFSTRYTTALERAAEKAVMQARISRSNSTVSLPKTEGSTNDLEDFGGRKEGATRSSTRVSEATSVEGNEATEEAMPNDDEENEEDDYDEDYDLKCLWEGADFDYLLVVDE